MDNLNELQALMKEKHTLLEWLVLFQKHPELRKEFDKIVFPKPIE